MSDAPDNIAAELVAGKYRLVRLIGQGGMGSVWEGQHVSLGTRVAVKFIETELADSEEARDRFDKEARAAAKLQSRYVVGVFDHGVMPDGRPFIVMEYLGGETLEERVMARGRLDLVDVALIIRQVAKGLAKAHALGIVHRDLKPENIFLTDSPDDDEQVAKVVDFGIAKFTEGAPVGMSSSTQTGTLLGTPVYMSPEQARGLRDIDHRSDLWALGVVVYRCVLGKLPFEGEAVGDILVKICTQDPQPPTQLDPSLPEALDAWFARSLAREREDRFDTVQESAAALLVAAGVVAHASEAFSGNNAISGPGGHALGVGEMPKSAQAASSKVELENAATQMGATTPVPLKARPRAMGVLGAVVALVGVLFVVGSLAIWRQVASGRPLDTGSAIPTGSLSLPSEIEAPRMGSSFRHDPAEMAPAPSLAAPAAPVAAASEPAEVHDAGELGKSVPSRRPPVVVQPTRVQPTREKPPKPPPGSTDTIELGY